NKTKVRLGINILADIKLGTRNSYEVIKLGGKKRKILYDTTGKEEEAQKLPRWFFPIDRFKTDFSKFEAGDGRNQELYNYIRYFKETVFPWKKGGKPYEL
ncbi:MAG: hypothetical protein IKN43_14835, partial [Selenomonadaceae bacterium]|nr:hypothetical protein [Selenomonadaceae bacterium]